MSNIIKTRNGCYEKLNIYEKFVKMNHSERRDFLKFLSISSISLATLTIPLVIAFNTYAVNFITTSVFILILLILIYFFFYKKNKNGFAMNFG